MSQPAFTHDEAPLPRLAPRAADSHKGTFGRAVLIGGSRGMTGAIGLAGMAALRGGAGLVRLAVPRDCQDVVAGYHPSYMTAGLKSDDEGRLAPEALPEVLKLCQEATALGCGPGLGRSPALNELVCRLYAEVEQPMVVDADALNAIAARRGALARPGGSRVLTPHPGELARLAATDVRTILADREQLAADFARQHGVVLVLKGHRTVITDGRRLALNATGNPGMATGGTGDVLTGLLTALLCQGLTPYDAARLGVHLHGLAGDLVAERLGEVSLVASDLLDALGEAFRRVGS